MPKPTVAKKKPATGIRITKGSKWKLTDKGGVHREFSATVIESWTGGGGRIVLLSVPTRARKPRKPQTKKKSVK